MRVRCAAANVCGVVFVICCKETYWWFANRQFNIFSRFAERLAQVRFSLLERAATTLIRAWNGDSSLTECSFNLSHPLSSLSTRPLCLSLSLLKRHLSLETNPPFSLSHDLSWQLSPPPPPPPLSKWHLSEKNLYKSPSFPAFWIQCRHTHGLIHRSMLVMDQLYGCAASISTILTFMLSACITMQKSSTQKVRVKYHIGEGPVWVSTIIPYSVVA